eukprot:Polyplicarium_translucidae@DN1954_c0_g1_i1.p1
MKLLAAVALLAVALPWVGCRAHEETEHVVALTEAEFPNFMTENRIALVMFYAPWCGHCKKLAPDYDKAALALKEDGVPLCKVDATVETGLAQTHGVRAYPTIKLFRNGKPEDYTGGRSEEQMVSWVRQMTGPAVSVVDSEGAKKAISDATGIVVVGHFASSESPMFKIFETVADASRLIGRFVAHFGDGAADEVSIHRPNEDAVKTTVKEEAALTEWLQNERFPLFGPIDGENYATYVAREQDVAWFAGSKADFESVSEVMRAAAKNFRDKYSFVWLNTEKFQNHAEQSLGIKEFPGLVLQSKGGRFVFPDSKFTDAAKVTEFFRDIQEGKITRSLKSDPVPEVPDDEGVVVVVGKNFEEIVMNAEKDVMLEVYAPWCGHCKKLAPIYKEFAEAMAENTHVVVAKMDGTTNESPVDGFEWQGFPTLFFVKAGETEPMLFDGARTLEGLTTFMKKHSSKPLASAASEKDEL